MSPGSIVRSRVLPALAILAGAVLCAHGGAAAAGLLFMAPALALAAMLSRRRYPGERLLGARLGRDPERRTARAGHGRRRRLPISRTRVPRGGLLMAFSLAVRPPPRLQPAS